MNSLLQQPHLYHEELCLCKYGVQLRLQQQVSALLEQVRLPLTGLCQSRPRLVMLEGAAAAAQG